MTELTTQFSAALSEVAKTGPQWIQSLRDAGRKQFQAHGLPTRKDEAWKYTGLGGLDQASLQLDPGTEAEASEPSQASPLLRRMFTSICLMAGFWNQAENYQQD